MKTKLSLLLVATCIINLIPLTAFAFTFEDLAEALSYYRACPVQEIVTTK